MCPFLKWLLLRGNTVLEALTQGIDSLGIDSVPQNRKGNWGKCFFTSFIFGGIFLRNEKKNYPKLDRSILNYDQFYSQSAFYHLIIKIHIGQLYFVTPRFCPSLRATNWDLLGFGAQKDLWDPEAWSSFSMWDTGPSELWLPEIPQCTNFRAGNCLVAWRPHLACDFLTLMRIYVLEAGCPSPPSSSTLNGRPAVRSPLRPF